MSCSVIALPIYLVAVISGITTNAIANKVKSEQYAKENAEYIENLNNLDISKPVYSSDIIEKDFETPFTDKELLIKTLEEHGFQNVEENFEGKINGVIDSFNFEFQKSAPDQHYHLKITCNKNDNAEEKVSDISAEYALNSQEAAYLSILENIKNTNMQIESETVEEDNTIVLTINLD